MGKVAQVVDLSEEQEHILTLNIKDLGVHNQQEVVDVHTVPVAQVRRVIHSVMEEIQLQMPMV
jgi:hypothetical protein